MRQPPNRLRNSIILSFSIFGLVLTALYGTLMFVGIQKVEDQLFSSQLHKVVSSYLQSYDPTSASVDHPGLRIYVGTERMDADLFQLVGKYPDGYYELHIGPDTEDRELQFAVSQIPGSDDRLYVVYNVDDLEISEKQQEHIIGLLALGGAIVCGIGIGLGFLLAKRVTTPLSRLTNAISNFTGDELPTNLVSDMRDDEVAYLARSLEKAHRRINHFLIREKEFTTNASHELRTPLTVIKGASELIKVHLPDISKNIARPLGRIERSISEMELTIETFLLLARENSFGESDTTDLGKVSKELVESLAFLAQGKDITLEVIEDEQVHLVAPLQVIKTVISNLLRNSLRHTARGRITVTVRNDRLEVADTGSGIESELIEKATQPGVHDKYHGNTGFGLSIVERICNRFNWHLHIESDIGKGTVVTISFPDEAC